MFDIGFFELLVVGIVALIVVGPKELPVMFRTVGRFTGKARAMAREFTSAMNQAADDAGVRDIQKGLKDLSDPKQAGLNAINEAAEAFENWDPMAAADEAAGASDKAEPSSQEGPLVKALREDREAKAAAAKAEATARAEARQADSSPDGTS